MTKRVNAVVNEVKDFAKEDTFLFVIILLLVGFLAFLLIGIFTGNIEVVNNNTNTTNEVLRNVTIYHNTCGFGFH